MLPLACLLRSDGDGSSGHGMAYMRGLAAGISIYRPLDLVPFLQSGPFVGALAQPTPLQYPMIASLFQPNPFQAPQETSWLPQLRPIHNAFYAGSSDASGITQPMKWQEGILSAGDTSMDIDTSRKVFNSTAQDGSTPRDSSTPQDD